MSNDKKIIDKNEFEDIIKELRLVDKDLSYGLIHREYIYEIFVL